MIKRLAIVTTHPIQYNAPFFALLSSRKQVTIKVFYTWGDAVLKQKYDPGFGKNISWDIPLLEGYDYEFVINRAASPGSHHFKGIDNPTLIDTILRWGPDAMLVFGWAFISHLKVIRYFHRKIPVLFRGDSTLLRKQSGLKTILRNLFLRWVYSHVDYALYAGTQNKLYFEKYGLRKNQLVYAPHAIDNQRFADDSGEYEKAAHLWRYEELGLQQGNLIILYAGKLEDIKEPGFIIELGKTLAGLPVQFIIVGNGPLEKSIKLEANSNSQFIFIDFQNQQKMPVVYRLGDLFILSSKSETWGLGINEAMASRRGVLVRDTCGCATDLVADDVNGYIFSVKDITGLADKIKLLINDHGKVKKMGKESLLKIQPYSFESIVQSIEGLMTRI